MAIERVVGTALVALALAWAPDGFAADRRDARRHRRGDLVSSHRDGSYSARHNRSRSRVTHHRGGAYGRSARRVYDPYHGDYRPYPPAYGYGAYGPYGYEGYAPYDGGYAPYGYAGYGRGYAYDPYHYPGFYIPNAHHGHPGLLSGHIALRLGGGRHRGGHHGRRH